MSKSILEKLNKKATNYSVSRKKIDGCASEGYIFTSDKIKISSYEARILTMQLVHQEIVQAVEVYCADQSYCYALRKTRNDINGIHVTTENQRYTISDYFSDQDNGLSLAVIKITTFDTPIKHLRKISIHRNNFLDVLRYLVSYQIQALTELYPVFEPTEESISDIQLQLINCDQYEYRLKQLVVNDMESNYFEFEMMMGEKNVPELLKKIGRNQFRKVKGVYCIDPKMKQAICAVSKDIDEFGVEESWTNLDIHTRDRGSIFDINYDYISLLVKLKGKDLEVLKKLKSGQEALNYICK